jgi:hypothetical protein
VRRLAASREVMAHVCDVFAFVWEAGDFCNSFVRRRDLRRLLEVGQIAKFIALQKL